MKTTLLSPLFLTFISNSTVKYCGAGSDPFRTVVPHKRESPSHFELCKVHLGKLFSWNLYKTWLLSREITPFVFQVVPSKDSKIIVVFITAPKGHYYHLWALFSFHHCFPPWKKSWESSYYCSGIQFAICLLQ